MKEQKRAGPPHILAGELPPLALALLESLQPDGPGLTQDLVRQARSLAAELAERAPEHDRAGTFPAESFDALKAGGLLALMVPQDAGGLGADFLTYTLVLEALALGDPAVALTFNMHNIVVGSLTEWDPGLLPDRRSKRPRGFRDWVFQEVIDSRRVFAAATSEPGIGSRFTQLRTTYERVPGGFVVSGTKSFVSMASYADYYVVAARAAGSEMREDVSYLVVERSTPGVTVEVMWDTLGMRATDSQVVHFRGCFVPEDRLFLGSEGAVLYKILREPHWLVGGYNGVYLGVCDAILHFVASYLGGDGEVRADRSRDPLVQHQMGQMDVQVEAARTLVYAAAAAVVRARGSWDTNVQIHRAKYAIGECAPQVASDAIRLCGGSTIARRYALERLYRDARCGGLMPAKSDDCLGYVGHAALGRQLTSVEETYW